MQEQTAIEHIGTVANIDDDTIYVNIEVGSACSGCHAQGFCSSLGSSNKTIEVSFKQFPNTLVGDKVIVSISESLGMKALMIGYIIPACILIASLVFAFIFIKHEGIAALTALASVALYYLIIWYKKDLFKKQFNFKLRPFDEAEINNICSTNK